jgi:hypothetical protein
MENGAASTKTMKTRNCCRPRPRGTAVDEFLDIFVVSPSSSTLARFSVLPERHMHRGVERGAGGTGSGGGMWSLIQKSHAPLELAVRLSAECYSRRRGESKAAVIPSRRPNKIKLTQKTAIFSGWWRASSSVLGSDTESRRRRQCKCRPPSLNVVCGKQRGE